MELLFTFPDQSESFVLGVEFGRLLERFERQVSTIENNGFPIHVKNIEVFRSACEQYGYTPVFGDRNNEWIDFIGIKNINKN